VGSVNDIKRFFSGHACRRRLSRWTTSQESQSASDSKISVGGNPNTLIVPPVSKSALTRTGEANGAALENN
jgi:hypothetical protein